MNWYRTGDGRRVAAVLRVALGEALRGPLVRSGWLVLAAFMGFAAGRVSCEGKVSLFLAQFAVLFALLCSGETIPREYSTRRAVALLGCGVGRRQHFLATCAAWMTVHVAGCWIFGLLFVSVESLRHGGVGWGEIAGTFVVPLMALPVLCLGFVLSVVLPGWSNIAILLVVMLVLGLVGGADEYFGPLSTAARAVLGHARDAEAGSPAGAGLQPMLRAGGQLAGASLRAVLFLALGAWLVGTPAGRRRLGRTATRTES